MKYLKTNLSFNENSSDQFGKIFYKIQFIQVWKLIEVKLESLDNKKRKCGLFTLETLGSKVCSQFLSI